jgi:hypothetical protein
MPKNSANKQYLRVKNSSLLNDVKDSAGPVIYSQNSSLPQPPPNVTSASLCFNYTFNSSAFTETKTGTGIASGYTYYNLTHGVVWSDGTNWHWTNALGELPTGNTRYSTMNNLGKIVPNSIGYSWDIFSGASVGTIMYSSLRGTCTNSSNPPSSGVTLCFDYTFSSSGYTDTETGVGTYSGFTYYNLTNGVVWSDGGAFWYWTASLGNTGTTYGTLYNGGRTTPNSSSYNWNSGATSLMNSSLIGGC